MNLVYIKLGWVKPSKVTEFKGLSYDSLKEKRRTGHFIEGVHWRKAADGNIYYNFEAIDEWIQNGGYGHKQTG